MRFNLRLGLLVNARSLIWFGIATVFGNAFALAPRAVIPSLCLLAAGAALTYCMIRSWSPRLR